MTSMESTPDVSLRSRPRSLISSTSNSLLGHEHAVKDRELHALCRNGSSSHFSFLFELLEKVNLPGPNVMMPSRTLIGQGAQFAVYEQIMIWQDGTGLYDFVAVKEPKFDLNGTNTFVDLSDQAFKNDLTNVIIEVKALTTPSLMRHPNIVKLLSWSVCDTSIHHPITLVLELADSDLLSFLAQVADEGPDEKVYPLERYMILADVASGLDAIHDCDMVHGDLKPSNVLIFNGEHGLIAKLADFGLAVGFGSLTETGHKTRLHGTVGWQSPEVRRGQFLDLEELQRADVYSFGLLAWSVVLSNGMPPCHTPDAHMPRRLKEDIENLALPSDLSSELTQLLTEALQPDAVRRPRRLSKRIDIAKHLADGHDFGLGNLDQIYARNGWNAQWAEMYSDMEIAEETRNKSQGNAALQKPHPEVSPYAFHITYIPDHFVFSLISQFSKSPESIEPDKLFSLFLCLTTRRRVLEFVNVSESLRLDILVSSARLGYFPAKAVLPVVFEFYQKTYPKDVKQELRGWLADAVASGSLKARAYLAEDPEILAVAMTVFKDNGGYAYQHYRLGSMLCPLHSVASFGTINELRDLVDSDPDLRLEEETMDGETALYLAMARGAWDVASYLLERGADATVACTEFHISTLHWSFSCKPAEHPLALAELTRHGADINGLVSHEVPIPHWPFLLPAGAPLHWAVVLQVETAIVALLEHGANPFTRDKSDPQKCDPEIRDLVETRAYDPEPYSAPPIEPYGLSALDHAAMNHDPFIFEALLDLRLPVDINDTDEEGLTVLHRLSSSTTRRTRSGFEYSALPFRSAEERDVDRLRRTVLAIKSLGGDLDKFTDPQLFESLPGEKDKFPDYTPLMLAVRRGCDDVVRSLVEAGADLEAQNSEGSTALLCLKSVFKDKYGMLRIVQILVSAGANIHHRDHNGNTALFSSARQKDIETMEILLSLGADATARYASIHDVDKPATIWAMAAGDMDESTERKFSHLLEQYVLQLDEPQTISEVVDRPSLRGETLLYILAGQLMLSSVQALIDYGADVNKCSWRHTVDRHDELGDGWELDTRFNLRWQETPLTAALNAKASMVEEMKVNKRYNKDKFNDLCLRADLVVAALRDAGGVEADKNEMRNLPLKLSAPWVLPSVASDGAYSG